MFYLVKLLVTVLPIVVGTLEKDLWHSFKRRDGHNINKTHLIHHYGLTCPILAGRGSVAHADVLLPEKTQVCQHQYCDDIVRCHCKGRCCSNSSLGYMTTSFFKSQVYPSSNGGKAYTMAIGCPYDFSDEMKQKCTETGFIPVTSVKTRITYKNKFCAKCHEEYVFVKWRLAMSCPNETQIQIHDYNNCSIHMHPVDTHRDIAIACPYIFKSLAEKTSISTCNETGSWKHYDGDIEWACHRFNRPFRHFKNIFCYICNPAITYDKPTPLISSCTNKGSSNRTQQNNETFVPLNFIGSLNESDTSYGRMCSMSEVVPRLSPFRNAYCFLCNRPVEIDEFSDIGKFEILNILPKQFLLKITLNDFPGKTVSAEGFIRKMNLLFKKFFNQTKDLTVNKRQDIMKSDAQSNTLFNLSEVFLQDLINVCYSDRICTRLTSMKNDTRSRSPCDPCSCSKDCVKIRYNECCLDILLTLNPYACVPESRFPVLRTGSIGEVSSELRYFKLIDKCFGINTKDSTEKSCTTNAMTDFWTRIPVRYSHTGFFAYQNIFCLLCNVEVPTEEIHVYLKVQCKNDIEPQLFPQLSDIFESVNYHKCQVYFTLEESYFSRLCSLDIKNIREKNEALVCFSNSKFEGMGKDINKVCSDNDHDVHVMKELSRINVNPYHEGVFKMFPDENRISTIIYCKRENSSIISSKHICFFKDIALIETASKTVIIRTNFNYRTIFTISRTELRRFKLLRNGKTCRDGTFDIQTGKCHKVFCSEGRVLQNGYCAHIFESVSNTDYLASFLLQPCDLNDSDGQRFANNRHFQSTVSPDISIPTRTAPLPTAVCSEIDKKIRNMLGDMVKIPYIHCRFKVYNYKKEQRSANMSEPNNETWVIYNDTIIQTNITVYVEFSDERSHIEERLFDIVQDKTFRLSQARLCSVPKNVVPNEKLGHQQEFYISSDNLHFNDSKSVVFIKKTLFCPLIEMAVWNLTLNHSTRTVSFNYSSKEISLQTNDVDISKHGRTKWRLRICKTQLEQFMRSESHVNRKGLDIVYFLFSTFCNLISLLSLMLTLLTYVIFKVLRTVPGRNNMSLALCLLMAQLCLQYAQVSHKFSSDIHCQILGMCIHYFWLGTFCALNICSFHMYRVFSDSLISRPDHDKALFLKYTVYVYGCPALLVLVVAVANFVTRGAVGYGELLCFLDDFYSVVGSFLVPSCLIFSTNVFFYGITFYKINSSPTLRSNIAERNTLSIYVRLCTITGVTWPLLFLDALFPLSIVSYLVTFINAMQGFFIFVSFICNRRVWYLYKEYVYSQGERDTVISRLGTLTTARSLHGQ